MNRFQKLSITATVFTVLLIVIGALVRVTGSGLGCPDWPRCFGSFIPPMRATALIEYSHRLTASIVGGLILAVAVWAWLKFRAVKGVFWPALACLITVLVQGWLGRQVVLGELPRNLVAVHFALSLTVLGLITMVTANSFSPRGGRFTLMSFHAALASLAVLVTGVLGAFVSQYEASLVFSDWPLMDGSLLPPGGGLKLLHYGHRIAAVVLGVMLGHFALRVTRLSDFGGFAASGASESVPPGAATPPRHGLLLKLAHIALAIWIVQVALGALNVLFELPPWSVVLHLGLGALLWSVMVMAAVVSYRMSGARDPHDLPDSRDEPATPAVSRAKAYFMLTKPRIIELLLITTVPAMIVAADGWPPLWLIAATLAGGSLAAGSANAINCYFDRDIDAKMERTALRPLPQHQVESGNALAFGVVLGIVGFVWLAVIVNLAAALYATSAIAFYVFIYTLWLKRTTPSNIVIGGAAGAVPVLVGFAAVGGRVGPAAWVMFAIIFYWTPPHFWALALKYSEDYRSAGVPMLPVARGVNQTTRQILVYSVALLAVTLALYPAARLGDMYLYSAAVLGVAFIVCAARLKSVPSDKRAMSLFRFSITYLVLLFVAIAADRLIGWRPMLDLYNAVGVAAAAIFVAASVLMLAQTGSGVGAGDGDGSPSRRTRAMEFAWTLAPIVLMFVLLGSFVPGDRRSDAFATTPVLVEGTTVPAGEMRTLDGRSISFDRYRGRPILVNFWASWCGPCVREFPRIEAARRAQPDLVVIDILFRDAAGPARAFMKLQGATWPSVDDSSGQVARMFSVSQPPGIPQSFFIDRRGVLRSRAFGLMSQDLLDSKIAQISAN